MKQWCLITCAVLSTPQKSIPRNESKKNETELVLISKLSKLYQYEWDGIVDSLRKFISKHNINCI